MAENAKDPKSSKEKNKANAVAKVKKSFREMRGEMKKVVWPSRKQTINNTGIVLSFMAIMAIIIGVFDAGLGALVKFTFRLG